MFSRRFAFVVGAVMGAASIVSFASISSAAQIRDHRPSVEIRDHRAQPQIRDHRSRPQIRDHRSQSRISSHGGSTYRRPQGDGRVPYSVVSRDHRGGSSFSGGVSVRPTQRPMVRDHR